MSKFLPDPQIQSLRAMRAGDIAFASGGIVTVGVAHQAIAQPIVNQPTAPPAPVQTLEPVVALASENPLVGVVDTTTLSQDALESINVAAVASLEALSGTPSETPVIGVATGTTVI
jgi:hypothetical protein